MEESYEQAGKEKLFVEIWTSSNRFQTPKYLFKLQVFHNIFVHVHAFD